MSDPIWYLSKDGDKTLLALYERHYPCYHYKDGRKRSQFVGPGQSIVLRTEVGDAGFVWRKFIDDSGQRGVNCAFFRNESPHRSSELIRQADAIADIVWRGERRYTYVDPQAVGGTNPGYCFIAAGWRRCGWTKSGKLILEKFADSPNHAAQCITARMSNALYLPDWTVTAVETIDGDYRIAAAYDLEPDSCPSCGVVDRIYKHGKKVTDYRDAPVHGRATVIAVTRPRYRCRECGATFMQPLPDMDDDRRMTMRCRDYIAAQCLMKPNTHVADDVGINEKVVRQIGKENAAKLVAKHEAGLTAPRVLGIDELKLGGVMRCIFVDIEARKPIELLPTHAQAAVIHFLANLPGRDGIEVVTMDMWRPYKTAVKATLPKAVIVIDKWHVQRLANDAMERARRLYQADVKKSDRIALKRGRTMFLRRPFQLTPQEILGLDGWLQNTPELRGAYDLKEGFMNIWSARSREEAKGLLESWRASVPTHLAKLFRPVTIAAKNWEPEIMNYFDHRFTNAPTEASNRVIKMANRIGAGYGFDQIRARALFGKRRGRATKIAAKLAIVTECISCKAWFGRNKIYEVLADGTRLYPSGEYCDDCERFHTQAWFGGDHQSTPKSE